MTATPGQVACEAWAAAHGWPAGFRDWEHMPELVKPKWEAVAAAVRGQDSILLQVTARQVEDIHYALGLGRDEDGGPVAVARLTGHFAPDGLPGDGEALVSALGELILAIAKADHAAVRDYLGTCYMCRNRLLYLLDTAPYAGSAYHRFAHRILALPEDHRSHLGPPVQGRPDERAPQIRGITS